MDPSPVEVHAHPPERRRRQTVTLPCGCCCCCCCCLHTIGGLIGAVVGSVASAPKPERPHPHESPTAEERFILTPPNPAVSAASLYWIVLGVLTCAVGIVSCVGWPGDWFELGRAGGPVAVAWLLAIYLPGVQIAASLVAMLVNVLADRDHAAARTWAVAKITFGTLIGTGAGIGIMFLACVAWPR